MPRGQSFIEIIVALAIFMIGIVAAAAVLGIQFSGARTAAETLHASTLAESGLAAARVVRNNNWFLLTPGIYGVSMENNTIALDPTPDTTDIFTRTLTITAPNATTRDVTSTVTWQSVAGRTRSLSMNTQITNWRTVGYEEIEVWGDWSNPIIFEPELDLDGEGTGVAVRNGIAYLSVKSGSNDPDFYIIDVTDPATAFMLGELTIPDNSKGSDDVAIHENYAYLASRDEDFVLHIVDISDPAHPSLISNLSLPNFDEAAKTVAVDYPYVYLGTYEEGGEDPGEEEFIVVDVSDPTVPIRVAAIEIDGDTQDIVLFNNLAYVAVEQGGGSNDELIIIDISNPTNPLLAGGLDPEGNHTGYGVSIDTYQPFGAFVRREGNPELFMLDTSNPLAPTTLGSKNSPEHFHKVILKYPIVYASGSHNNKELVIYDAEDPNELSILVEVDLRANAEGMAFEQNYLYVATQKESYPLAIFTAE